MAAAGGIVESTFPNYLNDTFHITAAERGRLEFPRELPGFLVVLTSGALAIFAVTRVGAIGATLFCAGLLGLSQIPAHYGLMTLMLATLSTGTHLIMPVDSTIAIALSDETNRGRRMGQVGLFATAGGLLGCAFVWMTFSTVQRYSMGFWAASIIGLGAIFFYGSLRIPHLHQRRRRLVFRKKYRLYYTLELIFGARKQIFLTFGPWVLIEIYGLAPRSIAALFLIAGVIGLAFKPLAGIAIDRFGERVILTADGLAMVLVSLGYGYAQTIMGSPSSARLLAECCFIADALLFALGAGRAVYLSRLVPNPQELNSSLAMGVSINHVVSMIIPTLAGLVWVTFGYSRVFLAAAVLTLINAVFSSMVPGKGKLAKKAEPPVLPPEPIQAD